MSEKTPIKQTVMVTITMTKEVELETTQYDATRGWDDSCGYYDDYVFNTDFTEEVKEQVEFPKSLRIKDMQEAGWCIDDITVE